MKHAELMQEKRRLSHQFSGEPSLPLRLAQSDLRLDRSAENVAYDAGVEQAHIGLMNSPPHRANILSPDYNAIGIAIVRRGQYIYVVEDFAHSLPVRTVPQVEQDLAANFNRLREEAKQPAAHQVHVGSLRRAACTMADQDEVNARKIEVPAARQILTFTMIDPRELPSNLRRLAVSPDIASFAVGVCFQRTPTYPSGVYWSVMAFFPRLQPSSASR